MPPKKRVLFVGSFKNKSSTGHVGGQMFACTSLVGSELNEAVDFILLDSTASTNQHRSMISRSANALARLTKFFWLLITRRAQIILLFCSNGWSFVEKGIMLKIAAALGRTTIIAPRSGHLMTDIENSEKTRKFVKGVFEKADYVLCQGKSWKQYFIEHLNTDEKKLFVRYNWIDIQSIKTDANSTPHEQTLRILFMGWMERNKGIYEILEVADRLRDYPVKWTLAGDGKETEPIRARIKELNLEDRIELPGWVLGPQKAEMFHKSNALVIASYREGLPNILLESMVYGLPVIATDVGAIADVIEHDFNGLIFQPGDVDMLYTHVRKLLDHPELREQFRARSLERVHQEHSIDGAVKTFKKLFKVA